MDYSKTKSNLEVRIDSKEDLERMLTQLMGEVRYLSQRVASLELSNAARVTYPSLKREYDYTPTTTLGTSASTAQAELDEVARQLNEMLKFTYDYGK